jgi:hypothetical protein
MHFTTPRGTPDYTTWTLPESDSPSRIDIVVFYTHYAQTYILSNTGNVWHLACHPLKLISSESYEAIFHSDVRPRFPGPVLLFVLNMVDCRDLSGCRANSCLLSMSQSDILHTRHGRSSASAARYVTTAPVSVTFPNPNVLDLSESSQ